MQQDLIELQQILGYEFKDIGLLEAALTHRSAQGYNNERLEFLGDAIVNFVIADVMYRTYPEAREGKLSRLRSALVKGEALAGLAREFNLGEYLRLGHGELKSGGAKRESILADAMEAIIGAIYLDSDLHTCQQCILAWCAKRLENIEPDAKLLKDPKTRLQELLQSRRLALPNYSVVKIKGKQHEKVFRIKCCVTGIINQAEGIGSSRRKAEQSAAENLLALLENDE